VGEADRQALSPFDLLQFSKAPASKFTNMIFGCPKMVKFFEVIKKIIRNNFPFWVLFQILLYCML
jgi:hypothetical protein